VNVGRSKGLRTEIPLHLICGIGDGDELSWFRVGYSYVVSSFLASFQTISCLWTSTTVLRRFNFLRRKIKYWIYLWNRGSRTMNPTFRKIGGLTWWIKLRGVGRVREITHHKLHYSLFHNWHYEISYAYYKSRVYFQVVGDLTGRSFSVPSKAANRCDAYFYGWQGVCQSSCIWPENLHLLILKNTPTLLGSKLLQVFSSDAQKENSDWSLMSINHK
jgi:hypothetical protein